MKRWSAAALALMGTTAFAAGGGAELVNYYKAIGKSMGMEGHSLDDWMPVMGALMTLTLLLIGGVIFKRQVEATGENLQPPASLGVRSLFENILEFVFGIGESVIGKHTAGPFLPLLSAIFLFIFVSNAFGLVPGFPPATESMNTNLAIGITVFFVYNICGMREVGVVPYLKHFMGPVWWLAPLFILIELVSHAVRPVSLSLRLYGNLFGDHLVMSVVTGLTGIVVPLVCFLFGTLVAILQSLVFTLLSSIYISMAIAHEEH